MKREEYRYSLRMSVRDYEVDYQGIVNNANYLHYLEHTRHEFCLSEGLTFKEMHERGIDPVVRHVEIDYISPLRIGDDFISCLNIERKGPRFVFLQDIYKEDLSPVIKSRITIVCLENGVLSRGEVIAQAFGIK